VYVGDQKHSTVVFTSKLMEDAIYAFFFQQDSKKRLGVFFKINEPTPAMIASTYTVVCLHIILYSELTKTLRSFV
jgi:hypothetical protein